jgi:hypothetical protein
MQSIKFLASVAVLLASLLVTISCADNDVEEEIENETCATEVSYQANVKTIIETRCATAGCHNGSLGASRDWSNFSTLQAKAQTGAIKGRVVAGTMPPSGSLSADEINAISCWADQGAKDN